MDLSECNCSQKPCTRFVLNEGDDSFVSQAEMVTLTLCEETSKLSSYIDINDFLSAS